MILYFFLGEENNGDGVWVCIWGRKRYYGDLEGKKRGGVNSKAIHIHTCTF